MKGTVAEGKVEVGNARDSVDGSGANVDMTVTDGATLKAGNANNYADNSGSKLTFNVSGKDTTVSYGNASGGKQKEQEWILYFTQNEKTSKQSR